MVAIVQGAPVVVVASGGLPVTKTTDTVTSKAATPVVVVTAFATPVTVVAAGGAPVSMFNPDGTAY